MQTNSGGFFVSQGAPASGAAYPGSLLQPIPPSLATTNQTSPWANMAMGNTLANAPQQQTGVSQGLTGNSPISSVSNALSVADQGSLFGDLFGTTAGGKSKISQGLSNAISGIDNIGVDLGFGLAKGAPVIGGVGPTNVAQVGSLGTSTPFSSVLGGAGFGLTAGGYLGKLFGGSEVGSTIGGGIGGAIGSVALGGLSTGLGTALGAAGSVLPGVGTVIGTVAGSLLGGMFGGKKNPHPISGFGVGTIEADGKITGGNLSAKHVGTDIADNMRGDFQSFLKRQAKEYGITFDKPLGMGAVYSPTDRRKWGADSQIYIMDTEGKEHNFYFDINNKESKQNAYQEAFNRIAISLGKDPATLTKARTNQGEPILVKSEQQESPFDKFLREYRERQNANLA